MNLFAAIDKMKMMSREGKTFSFTFMTYSSDKRKSNGIRHVERAILDTRTRDEKNKYGEYMLYYKDFDDDMQRHQFWIPLLMEFEGEPIEIDDYGRY